MNTLHNMICRALLALIGDQPYWFTFIGNIIILLLVLAVSILSYYVFKYVVTNIIRKQLLVNQFDLVHTIFNHKTSNLFNHLCSGWIFWSASSWIIDHGVSILLFEIVVNKIALLYIFITILLIISSIIVALNNLYENRFDFAKQYPIYNYLKVIILFVWIIGIILITLFFTQTSPWSFLTGVGALSAVLILVFKDTLLGIVASIQATVSSIVRVGDRISIDDYGIDGRVLDIAITTVKVRNADNTIANIPTYNLTSKVVKNWRSMEESGGRRIKTTLFIDMESLHICSPDLLQKLQQVPQINKYLTDDNTTRHADEDIPLADQNSVSQEQIAPTDITNITLYRHFIRSYLYANAKINKAFTVLVHHLNPESTGLPVEIIAFTHDTSTIGHEMIKSEILEYCVVHLSLFELKAYQT